MNEKKPIYTIIGFLGLVFILGAIFVSVYYTPKEPVGVRPRAESTGHRLGFHIADRVEQTLHDEVALTQGKEFSLMILLSNGPSLEQGKKYKFHLKFDYNSDVLTLNVPRNRKLNNEEIRNSNIIAMDSIFTEGELSKVEEKDGKLIEIEGFFKSDSYASLAQNTGRNSDRIMVVNLKQFSVKPGVSLTDDMKLFAWYQDGETKVSREDATFLNPDEDLWLTLVDKNKGDILTSETVVVPEPGSDITEPLGGIKAEPTIVIPGQTTQTTGTTGGTTLNLSLKFQGILKKPDAHYNSMQVKISIAGGTLPSALPPQTGVFTADEQGVWTGSVSFPAVSPGSNYRILVKGPKHLQKRICDANPSESYPGSYACNDGKMSLQAGVNTFDFSKVYQLAGDLPEQNGVQNGFTNSYDTSLIRNNLNSADPNILKFADLNLDGIVNTQDFSLVIAALEFRSDEQ